MAAKIWAGLALIISMSMVSLTSGAAADYNTYAAGGVCPTPPLQQNFDIARYMGKWLAFLNVPSQFSKGTQYQRCMTANYTLRADGTVRVVNSAIVPYIFPILGFECPFFKRFTLEGNGFVRDPIEPALLEVSFNPNAPKNEPGSGYQVVETDYVNYAITYNCDQSQGALERMWILKRTLDSPVDLPGIYRRLRSYGINPDNFVPMDHTNCSEWPVPGEDDAVDRIG